MIPVVGDVTNLSLNYFLVVRKAKQVDIPQWLLKRMMIHNVISTGVGFVPLVGDVMIAVYKANSRNAALLEEFLRIRGEEFLKLNTGPDGRALNAQEKAEQKKGWAWFKKRGVSPKDAEQVKPGAGLVEGEVVPTAPIDADLVEERVDERVTVPAGPSSSAKRGLNGGRPTSAGSAKGSRPTSVKSWKGLSLFNGVNGGKRTTAAAGASKTGGRFVENISAEDIPRPTA